MKEVKITLNGKEYKKTRPVLLDLRNMAEYQKSMLKKLEDGKTMRKNVAVDEEAQDATIKLIASFLGAPESEFSDDIDLAELFEAMRNIDANIAEAMTGQEQEKNADGR